MLHNDTMIGAFSHSTAVGKLRQELPDVPSDARYTVEEAETMCLLCTTCSIAGAPSRLGAASDRATGPILIIYLN
jgi:hypothetical protein